MTRTRRDLADLRKAAGFTQESLAERLDIDRSTVRRWESGECEPQARIRPLLAGLLGISSERLRGLITSQDPEIEEQRQRKTAAIRYRHDAIAVSALRNQVESLDARYDRTPSTSLLPEAGDCLGQIRLLARSRLADTHSELTTVRAKAAVLVGQLVWDASQRRDHAAAHRRFDEAIAAAREVNDPTVEGLALLRKCIVALYGERNPGAALTLAERAVQTTATTSHVLSGLAILHGAESHAMLGERRDCERALASAGSRFERIAPTDSASYLFSPTQHGRMAGSCYLRLDMFMAATDVLEKTAKAQAEQSKSHAIVLGNLALAHLRRRQVDQAVATLHRAIDVVEQNRGGGGLTVVVAAGRELRGWRTAPGIDDIYDRLLTLIDNKGSSHDRTGG